MIESCHLPSGPPIGTGSKKVNEGADTDDVVDEWMTIQKTTRRRRPQRRRSRNYMKDASSKLPDNNNNNINRISDASRFLENAVSAQLKTYCEIGDSITPEQICNALDICLRELKESSYWDTLRQVLKKQMEAETHNVRFQSIVCYGIGNFGTKRPSAPLWQLALALTIRDYIRTTTALTPPITPQQEQEQLQLSGSGAETGNDEYLSTERKNGQRPPAMYYFEPLMTVQESEVLEKLDIRIIKENERGKRSVNNDDDDKNNGVTLFFMPHCPMSLYTNLFHTNWDCLQQVIVFGNSLSSYIDGGSNNTNENDPQKQQALEILEVLQPFWEVDRLKMSKKDISDRPAFFEQAFNDSSFTSFATSTTTTTIATTETTHWPKRPLLDSPHEYEYDGGEVM